ncbi:DUF2764 family protein [bacterium]|nr:DUF2764 family protein [bacterium]
MDKYVYLIAQLPALKFDRPSYMNIPMFMEEAGKWMNRLDLKKLQSVVLMDPVIKKKDPPVVQRIQKYERQMRQDIAQWRQAGKKGIEVKPENFPVSVLKEGDPLEIEKKLLHLRWQFIETIEPEHHFNLNILILYYLKLQILQKLSEYDKDKGMERFQQISKVTE